MKKQTSITDLIFLLYRIGLIAPRKMKFFILQSCLYGLITHPALRVLLTIPGLFAAWFENRQCLQVFTNEEAEFLRKAAKGLRHQANDLQVMVKRQL